MADYYIYAIVLLFALAVIDLVVGVSNDAVNFLNSAMGSKVASLKWILTIAGLGVFLGASFSSGMMEIARKGIFNPELFFFQEVIIIFLAVMLTDIILLDLFNTFGMPTSTTVSIVFELLGAAFVVSAIKITNMGLPINQIGDYINTSSAALIIAGIFLSIFIAFNIGIVVQYFSRLLLSFQYEKRMKYVGGIWAGLAFTAILYFLFFKGLKGASFVSELFVAWLDNYLHLLLFACFIFFSALMQLLILLKINVLKGIVLFGTFALAMSFAGNDLVNFIGVPIAAFESYLTWKASGMAPTELLMHSLAIPVKTNTYLLLTAGLIMVLTLWFSRKAKSVTETEVNLGRQDEGNERFQANTLARQIVRLTVGVGEGLLMLVPTKLMRISEYNFIQFSNSTDNEEQKPAFDMVRASVNLTVASLLISLATSFKLPLSTTYVSFMVAMGSSLADRAWDRESAVYRVSGVLSVVGGWLLTALVAFSAAGLFAAIIYNFHAWGVGAITLFAAFSMYRSFQFHRKKESVKERGKSLIYTQNFRKNRGLMTGSKQLIKDTFVNLGKTYNDTLDALIGIKPYKLKSSQRTILEIKSDVETVRNNAFRLFQSNIEIDPLESRHFVQSAALLQDIIQSAQLLNDVVNTHIENAHKPLLNEQVEDLKKLKIYFANFIAQILILLDVDSLENKTKFNLAHNQLQVHLDDLMAKQFKYLKRKKISQKNNNLVFTVLLESRDLLSYGNALLKEIPQVGAELIEKAKAFE